MDIECHDILKHKREMRSSKDTEKDDNVGVRYWNLQDRLFVIAKGSSRAFKSVGSSAPVVKTWSENLAPHGTIMLIKCS